MSEIKEVEIKDKEFEYRYQAVDDLNRPLGAEQIFRGKTVQEVLDKVAEANKNLIRLNRELNKKIRLGEFEPDNIPEDVSRVANNLLQPRELTLEEKAQIARDISDPEKFDEANSKLIQAQFGANPSEIRDRINSQEKRLENIEARQEAEAFALSNADYYVCPENFRVITSWMVKNNLKPVRENFQYAFDTLKTEGLMLTGPVSASEPVSAPVSEYVAPVAPVPASDEPHKPVAVVPPVEEKHAPSGLTRDFASNSGTPVPKNTLTIRDIERMSSEEYKRRLLTDRSFAKVVDELYKSK